MRHLMFACAFLMSATAWATPVINVGNHNLLPQTAGQQIQISVSGGDTFNALNFVAQIGGGIDVPGEPDFTGLDLITGTVLQSTTDTPVDNGSAPQYLAWSVESLPNPSIANGLLVTLTVSTVGVNSGIFDLLMTGAFGDSTTEFLVNGEPIEAAIQNGTITVTPEPGSGLLASMAFAFGALQVRRRHLRCR